MLDHELVALSDSLRARPMKTRTLLGFTFAQCTALLFGLVSAVAAIKDNIAVFKPEGAEEECQLTLKFTGDKLFVTQIGICGFGHNVSAEGTYKKVSAKKPKFESG